MKLQSELERVYDNLITKVDEIHETQLSVLEEIEDSNDVLKIDELKTMIEYSSMKVRKLYDIVNQITVNKNKEDGETYVDVLENEIKVLRSRIEKHDTGHIYTTIDTLEKRVDELKLEDNFDFSKVSWPFPNDRPKDSQKQSVYSPRQYYQSEDGC